MPKTPKTKTPKAPKAKPVKTSRPCAVCGTEFTPRTSSTKCCSPGCTEENLKRIQREFAARKRAAGKAPPATSDAPARSVSPFTFKPALDLQTKAADLQAADLKTKAAPKTKAQHLPGLPWATPDVCALIAQAQEHPTARKARLFHVIRQTDGRSHTLAIQLPTTADEYGNAVPVHIPLTQIVVTGRLLPSLRWSLRPAQAPTTTQEAL